MGIFISLLLFSGLCGAGVIGKFRPTVSRLPSVLSLESYHLQAGITFARARKLLIPFLSIRAKRFTAPKPLSRCPLISPAELFWMMSLAWLVEVGLISTFCDSTQMGLFRQSDSGFSSSGPILRGGTLYRPPFFPHYYDSM